jgi:hypothetical protein
MKSPSHAFSYDYYAEVASEDVPIYHVELAKSNRSKCSQKRCSQFIQKGEIRCGSIDKESGTYTRWIHISCYRVPYKIQIGLPQLKSPQFTIEGVLAALSKMNDVLLSGFNELSYENKLIVVAHIMDQSNWARMSKKRSRDTSNAQTTSSTTNSTGDKIIHTVTHDATRYSTAVQTSRGFQLIAAPHSLQGKIVVMTGIFPEIGGGAGLNLGKARLKSLIESLGGRVTSSVSGKTDILLVGKQPGAGKVSQARSRDTLMLSTRDLKCSLEGDTKSIDNAISTVDIHAQDYSKGYRGNSIAGRISMGPTLSLKNSNKKRKL